MHKSEILDIHVNTIMESRNAYFIEDVFLYNSTQELNASKREYDTAISSDQDQNQEFNQEEEEDAEPRCAIHKIHQTPNDSGIL